MWGGSPEPRGASRPHKFVRSGLWRARAVLEDRPTQNVRTPMVMTSSTRSVSFTTYGSPYLTPIRLP